MDKLQIAYRLKEYMESNDLSKAQIGRFIGRDSRSVGRYLDGQMSDDIAVKLIELIKTGGTPMQEYTKKKKKGSKTAIGIRPEARAFVDTYKKLNNIKTDTDAITGIVMEWGEMMLKQGIRISSTLK